MAEINKPAAPPVAEGPAATPLRPRQLGEAGRHLRSVTTPVDLSEAAADIDTDPDAEAAEPPEVRAAAWSVNVEGNERILCFWYDAGGNRLKREVAVLCDWNGEDDMKADETHLLETLNGRADVQRQLDEARRDLKRKLIGCVWCAAEFPQRETFRETMEMMAEHMLGCEKHPYPKAILRAESAEAANQKLRRGAQKALLPIAALVQSGACVDAPTELTESVKLAILDAHDTLCALLGPQHGQKESNG